MENVQVADEAAIEVPEAADPPQATNATAATAPGTGPETAPISAVDAAIAVTASETKVVALNAVSVATSRETAAVVAVTVAVAADPAVVTALVAAATTLTTPADAEAVVTSDVAVAPTGTIEGAQAAATLLMTADAVVAETRLTVEAPETIADRLLFAETEVPAQGTARTVPEADHPLTAGAQLAATATPTTLAKTHRAHVAREDQDREMAPYPEVVHQDAAPWT